MTGNKAKQAEWAKVMILYGGGGKDLLIGGGGKDKVGGRP